MSRSEAKRLIKQGTIEIDGVKITDSLIPSSQLKNGSIIKIGKHHFIRVINTDEQ